MVQLARRHPLIVFFVLAYAVTWVVWIPRALGVQVGVVGQAWTWMPAVAALAAAALTGGRAAVVDLGRRLVRWRVAWPWYAVVIVGPAVFSLAVGAVYVLLGGSWSAALPPAFATPFPSLALFLVILTLTDGLGEEPGWRGFALPRLLERSNPLVASLVLGVLWAGWHLPLVWTEGSSLSGSPVWLLFLNLPATSVLFTWVFLRTRGSVLLAALLHGATNLFVVSPVPGVSGDLTLSLLATAAKWVLVIVLVAVAGAQLTRKADPEARYGPAGQNSTNAESLT
jgi:membrane protease YdiL (CAAX protease family)